jgi:hypothetical protein
VSATKKMSSSTTISAWTMICPSCCTGGACSILSESGIVRSDITSSFGTSTTKAEGVPLEITMTIQEFDADQAAYQGVAVYLWHCNRDGQYSLYSQAIQDENYLRGVQEADQEGQVRFTKATNSAAKIATSQLALPEAAARDAYPTAGYEQSLSNLSRVSLATDNVFGDGYDLQLPEVTGSVSEGYKVSFTCAVWAAAGPHLMD